MGVATWALIEIQFPPLTRPSDNNVLYEFSAFVETPDALNGIGPDDWLPIQGVALSKSFSDEYMPQPTIAFPGFLDGSAIAVVPNSNKFFSLRVDLQSFPENEIIRIGLYGQVPGATIVGGTGLSDGQAGTLLSSELYGSITKDYRGLNGIAWTPGVLAGAPNKLFIKNIFTLPDDYNVMVTSFPELAGVPHEILGAGIGDKSIGGSFHCGVFGGAWIPDDLTTSWSDSLGVARPSSVVPDDNPNSWGLFDFNLAWDGTDASITTTVNWGPGIPKTKTINCTLMSYDPANTGFELVDSVPLTVPAASFADVGNFYQVQYWVPTWHYPNIFTAQVKALCIEGVNLWDAYAFRDTSDEDVLHSESWENAGIYPDRIELGDLSNATIDSTETPTGDYTPENHFGHMRLGTITILRSTGEITFEPVVIPPVDGTPDGDGAIGDGSAPGRTANPHLRVWTFSLDGHDFYVLRIGDSLTLVYDTYSEQWMDWDDFDSLTWRAHCGRNWVGAEALGDTHGSNVIVGDDTYGLLWFLDPEQPFDDDPLGAVTPSYFSRVTMGQVIMKGREVLPCYVAWLTADMGAPAYSGAAVSLWMSDDSGETWELQDTIQVTAGGTLPELAWYSLGQIEAPGRLFKIFDDGAITRIDGLEMNDPDDQK